MKRGLLVLWAALAGFVGTFTSAHAASSDFGVRPGLLADQVSFTQQALENAFSRRMAVLDAETWSQAVSSVGTLAGLFPEWGFVPHPNAGLSWGITPLNDEQAQTCVQQVVSSVSQWNTLVSTLSSRGLSAANANCELVNRYSVAPTHFPAVFRVGKVLDRRDVPVATKLPDYPVLGGVDGAAVTRPGLTLHATQGTPGSYSAITVYNPFVLVSAGPPPVGLTLGLTGFQVREGFSVSHNCATVAPASSCTVLVRYNGSNSRAYVGSLQLAFSNGARATVGLLGTTP